MNALPRGAAFEAPDLPDDAYADGRVANETIERLKAAKAPPRHPFPHRRRLRPPTPPLLRTKKILGPPRP